jgi:hypothetical protein
MQAWPAWPVIVDRVAVAVGTSVVTVSQIELTIRVTALLNGETPDFGLESKRRTAERLVNQLLVRSELLMSQYPAPPASEAERLVEQLSRRRFHGSKAELRAALEGYGLTEAELMRQFSWQVTFLRFVEARFRGGAQITDEEIQSYFENVVLPVASREHPGQKISPEDYRDRIERVLTQRKVDLELEAWLVEARKRAAISFREEAF